MPARRLIRALVALSAAIALVAASGCGSSKPGYCADRSTLENAVKDISPSGGLSGLQSQLKTIQSDANKLVDSAQSDFPSETSAIRTSVNTLVGDVRALSSSPTPSQVATIAAGASSVVSAIRGFFEATSSKCD